ncbi:unnamed protein product [Paramecium octaurelia]|uniref:Uncharacterized protein n=1 Tax=Paramecium octaurelia TaxID=43137 RepID=A0A8S1WKX0_PAROT|nr:unnamed protein product [Paramecium octaurelia]
MAFIDKGKFDHNICLPLTFTATMNYYISQSNIKMQFNALIKHFQFNTKRNIILNDIQIQLIHQNCQIQSLKFLNQGTKMKQKTFINLHWKSDHLTRTIQKNTQQITKLHILYYSNQLIHIEKGFQ